MKANVIGNGSFGRFLKKNYFQQDLKSDNVVLAVPSGAFEEVCAKHKGKHLINVCSVQSETNKTCLKHSDRVTGIHPLFGHRSDPKDRICILTLGVCPLGESYDHSTILAFKDCETEIMSGEDHDKLMAKTHAIALEIGEKYAKHFRELNVDDCLLPASVRKLREVLYLLDGMPKGTVDSIKSNPFIT